MLLSLQFACKSSILESIYYKSLMSEGVVKDAKEKYKRILQLLQKAYQEKASEERMVQVFMNNLSRQFKLEVISDSTLEDVLKEYYSSCTVDFYATENFGKKLKFINRINEMFYRVQFTSKRQYIKMRDNVQREAQSPANQWLQNLSYLKSSSSLDEFRFDFLIRYCNLTQEKVNQLLESEETELMKPLIKAEYQKFFSNCLKEGVNTKIINYIEDIFSQFEQKSEMLSLQLLKELQKKLGISVGSDDIEIKINHSLLNLAQNNAYANDQEAQQRLQDQIQLLERSLRKFSGLNIFRSKGLQLRLGKFGSLTSGFAGIDADLDLTILTNCYINEIELLRLLHQFLRKQYKNDQNSRGSRRISVEFIQNAKTPLIQVTINERGKDPLKIDIIVNNILGIINSKFLSIYAGVKWVKNLGLLVKMWGKAQNLIGKVYLSSYAMILMLIHYLIKAKKVKPILDNRVITNEKPHFEYKRLKQTEIQSFKVYYMFKNNNKDVSIQERANYLKILKGFMKYYAYEIWNESDARNRIVTVDQSTQREVDPQTAITIKDPFDKPHNPGRLKVESRDFLIQKFKDAYEILQKGDENKIKQLFIN